MAPAWDILRGKEFDVLREENREWLEEQIGRTLVVHFGTECKTFNRARELQRPGWRFPKPLRSAQHPLGLPGLTAKEKESLSRGNEMAEISVQLAFKLLAAGGYFIIENPEKSRLWDLPEFVRLSKQAGVKEWICHNCMLGGRHRKATKFLSNLNLREVEKRCTDKDGKCDRTGCPHEPWEPWWDEAAQKTVHPSAEETEYPEELCEALAEGVCRAVDAQESSDGRLANYEWDFLEVFAGPNAPFSRAVEGRSVQTDKENPGTTSAQSVAMPECSGDAVLTGEDPKKEETKEERRERENSECIGGLRSPWKSVQKLPKLRKVGRQLRRILEDFLDAYPKFENMPQGGQQAEEFEKAQEIEELRRIIAEVLGTEDIRACDNGSPWRAGIVQAHINKSDDPESGLPRWLREGSPIGVARPVEPVGIFPRVDPEGKDRGTLEEILSEVAAKNNYKSFEEARKYAEPEVQRIIAAGYVKDLGTWKDVVKAYGKVAVSKLACIVKVRKNGSVKARLVIDLRRSGVNRCVRLSERVVLPRIKEVLEDATYLLSQAGAGDEVEAMVADFKDAFHTLPVHPEEKKFGVARTFGDHFIGFETIMFGGEASPLVWGRAAAYLNRGGQSLFEPHEFLAECFVDDPVLLAAGNAKRRRRSFAVFLLWMVVLGLPISWSKVSKGKRVEWCGSEIRLVNAFIVQAVLAESFVSDFAAEIEEALALPLIKRSTIRRIAGRAAWATGLVPTIRSFIDSLWAVSAELADDKQSTKKFRRGEPAVETTRVAVALKWLRAFLGRMVGQASSAVRSTSGTGTWRPTSGSLATRRRGAWVPCWRFRAASQPTSTTRSASSTRRRLEFKWARAGAKRCWRRWRLLSRFGHGCQLGPRAERRSSCVRTPRRRWAHWASWLRRTRPSTRSREKSAWMLLSPGMASTCWSICRASSTHWRTPCRVPLSRARALRSRRSSRACSTQKLILVGSRGGKQSTGWWMGQGNTSSFTSEVTQHLVARAQSRCKQFPPPYSTAASMWWALRRGTGLRRGW